MPARINEEIHTSEWLKTALGAIPNLATIAPAGVWRDRIPEDRTLPGIRYQVQSRHDVNGGTRSSQRIMVQIDWLVVGTVEGPSIVGLVPIADAIDVALEGQSGSTSTVSVLSCLRQSTFFLTEEGRSGVLFRHSGGIYRTLVTPL